MNLVSYLMHFLPTTLNASKNVTPLSWTSSQCISWTSSQHCCHSPNWHCLPHTSFCVTLCYSCYLSKRSLCISYFQHFSLFWKCFTKQAILEYLFLLKSIFTCIYLSVCQQTACVGVSSLLLPHRSWESISGHQAWRQEPVPAEPPLSPFLSPLIFNAFSSVGSVFTSPSSLCFYNANKFSPFFFLLLSQSFGINLSFKQMLFSYLFFMFDTGSCLWRQAYTICYPPASASQVH